MAETNQKWLRWLGWVMAILTAQLAGGALTLLISPSYRRFPFALAGAVAVCAMVTVTLLGSTRRATMLLATIIATIAAFSVFYGIRHTAPAYDVFGAMPGSFAGLALVFLGLAVFLFTGTAIVCGSPESRLHQLRWPWIFTVAASCGGLVIYGASLGTDLSPAVVLKQTIELENRRDSLDAFEKQTLSFYLGVLGRPVEARALRTWYADPDDDQRSEAQLNSFGDLTSHTHAWRPAIQQIAASAQIVIIMEDHTMPAHREWIQQTLEHFRSAGFTHFAIEALGEWGAGLKQRGFPLYTTGFYTKEPRFGNLLRRAIELGYELHEYDTVFARDAATREQRQAERLAKLFLAQRGRKILIHAGPAHVLKQPIPPVGKWMAARLWEKTGVEPFCIYQSSHRPAAEQYRRIADAIQVQSIPKLLMPVPRDLSDPQFASIPPGAVDALVVHPLQSGRAPRQRSPIFKEGLTRITGSWQGDEHPVVVGVYTAGEPEAAVALDQVLLRPGERDFELWAPPGKLAYRVYSVFGRVEIDVGKDGQCLLIRRAAVSR